MSLGRNSGGSIITEQIQIDMISRATSLEWLKIECFPIKSQCYAYKH